MKYCLIIGIVGMSMMSIIGIGYTQDINDNVSCASCSVGSPIMNSYLSWMNDLINIIDQGTISVDPGVVNGQGINLTRKRSESMQRAQYSSSRAVVSIDQQALGVKSDLRALDDTRDKIILSANTMINVKAVRSKPINPVLYARIQSYIQQQTGPTGILAGTGSWSDTMTYQQLYNSLLALHAQVLQYTNGGSQITLSWQGYRSNTTVSSILIDYYACSQSILSCNAQTNILEDRTATIRGYWADILRAGQNIKKVTSKKYWTFTTTKNKNGSINKLTDGYGDTLFEIDEDENDTTLLWGRINLGGSWKSGYKNIVAKRAAKLEQQQAQKNQEKSVGQSQQAIAKSTTTIPVSNTQTTQVIGVDQSPYLANDGTLLQQVLNKSSDNLLEERISMEQALIASDSSLLTHQIPALTQQIYDSQLAAQSATNAAYTQCIQHCNQPNNCGSPS